MGDNTPTEEQKRIKPILKRWQTHYLKALILTMSIICSLYLFLPPTDMITTKLVFVAVVILAGIAYPLIYRWSVKKFVSSATDEERKTLFALSEAVFDALPNARELRDACKMNAQKELLRASQQTQSDTLLRAAAYTDEKAQEQLLRPTDEAVE